MATKIALSRITIDIPKVDHQRLKAMAALRGKSMREIILEAIESIEECALSSHLPNKKTIKAIKDADNEKVLLRQEYAEANKDLGRLKTVKEWEALDAECCK